MTQVPAITASGVSVTYRNGHTALREASFSVPGGAIAALVGVNGSGKSTRFKAVMGFVRLAQGDIRILGMPTRQALRRASRAVLLLACTTETADVVNEVPGVGVGDLALQALHLVLRRRAVLDHPEDLAFARSTRPFGR